MVVVVVVVVYEKRRVGGGGGGREREKRICTKCFSQTTYFCKSLVIRSRPRRRLTTVFQSMPGGDNDGVDHVPEGWELGVRTWVVCVSNTTPVIEIAQISR